MTLRRLLAWAWWTVGARLFGPEDGPILFEDEIAAAMYEAEMVMVVLAPDSEPCRCYVASCIPDAVWGERGR